MRISNEAKASSGFRRGLALLALVPAALLALALPACGPSKVAECTELNSKINAGAEKLEKANPSKEGQEMGSAELKAMADTMDKTADDLQKAKTTIPELKDFSKKYQEMCKNLSKAARDMAAALDAKDVDKATKGQAALEAATQPEEALVESINKFCDGP